MTDKRCESPRLDEIVGIISVISHDEISKGNNRRCFSCRGRSRQPGTLPGPRSISVKSATCSCPGRSAPKSRFITSGARPCAGFGTVVRILRARVTPRHPCAH